MSFWSNQPVALKKTGTPEQILVAADLLAKIETELEASKLKLEYRIVNEQNDDFRATLLRFINMNYVVGSKSRLVYNDALFSYYLRGSLLIQFHPKGQPEKIIGFIAGRPRALEIHGKGISAIDVNFLCLSPGLRSMHLAPYMIGVLTKESVVRLGISLATYTVSSPIGCPHFGTKKMIHRPVHIRSLVGGGFFDVDIQEYERKYNTFRKVLEVKHLHKIDDPDFVAALEKQLLAYSRATYDAFDYKSVADLTEILASPAFHSFAFYTDGRLTDFLSFYRLDSQNITTERSYRNGYLYIAMLSDTRHSHVSALFDTVASHSLKYNLLDLLTATDSLPIADLGSARFIRGSGILNYYLFNMATLAVEPRRNGLVTI